MSLPLHFMTQVIDEVDMQIQDSKFGFAIIALLTLSSLLCPLAAAQESTDHASNFARFIPDDALVAGVWHGVSQSGNTQSAVEQSLTQGQLALFYQSLFGYFEALLSVQTEPELAEAMVQALSVSGMGYVRTDFQGGQPGLSAALVLEAGDATERIERQLQVWVQGLEKLESIEETAGHLDSYQIEPGLTVELGRIRGHWVMTAGTQEGRQLLGRVANAEPDWWIALDERLVLPRPLAIVSLNAREAIKNASQMQNEPLDLKRLLAITGLGGVERASMALGFDDQGYVHRTWIETDGSPQGLLAGLRAGQLTEQSLGYMPQDTTLGVVLDCDIHQLLGRAIEAADRVDPEWAANVRRGSQALAEELGASTLGELTQALGTPWALYHSPSQGGWINGVAMVIPVEDAESLRHLEKRWLDQIQDEVDNGGFFLPPLYHQSEYRGEKTHTYINFSYGLFTLSWCMTSDYLVVSLAPQNIKPILDRLSQDFGEDSPPLKFADERASAVFALDLKQLLGSPQGLAMVTGRMFESSIRRELRRFFPEDKTPEFATSHFPHGELIRELANEDRLAIYPQPDGILVEGRFTLPGTEWAFMGSLGTLAAVWMDEIGVDPISFLSPVAARRNESVNHLKMIGLAFHNYHATYARLPNYASTDKDGKPLLSWRVHLLPFLEQQQLYSQFHLDEPWDSEHNIKLIEQMPKVFRSPNSQAKPGYTNYVTIRSNDSLFPALDINRQPRTEGIRFGEVLDGLSNTVMVVEANDRSAVIWTQPDDLVPDMQILQQIVGLYRNQFAVLMADGRVIWLPSEMGHDTLLQVISRAGGEPIDFQEIMIR